MVVLLNSVDLDYFFFFLICPQEMVAFPIFVSLQLQRLYTGYCPTIIYIPCFGWLVDVIKHIIYYRYHVLNHKIQNFSSWPLPSIPMTKCSKGRILVGFTASHSHVFWLWAPPDFISSFCQFWCSLSQPFSSAVTCNTSMLLAVCCLPVPFHLISCQQASVVAPRAQFMFLVKRRSNCRWNPAQLQQHEVERARWVALWAQGMQGQQVRM